MFTYLHIVGVCNRDALKGYGSGISTLNDKAVNDPDVRNTAYADVFIHFHAV